MSVGGERTEEDGGSTSGGETAATAGVSTRARDARTLGNRVGVTERCSVRKAAKGGWVAGRAMPQANWGA